MRRSLYGKINSYKGMFCGWLRYNMLNKKEKELLENVIKSIEDLRVAYKERSNEMDCPKSKITDQNVSPIVHDIKALVLTPEHFKTKVEPFILQTLIDTGTNIGSLLHSDIADMYNDFDIVFYKIGDKTQIIKYKD